MGTKTASLQVAHQKGCPNEGKTGMKSLDGCRCKPSYYTLHRVQKPNGDYVKRKGTRLRDLTQAKRELAALQGEIAKGNVKWAAADEKAKSITFPAWVDAYQEILAGRVRSGTLAASTERLYAETLRMARESIDEVDLRQIGNAQIRRFLSGLGNVTPATRARRLRELGASFSEARGLKYVDVNPVSEFRQSAEGRGLTKQIKTAGRGSDPWLNDELPRLWEALRNGDGKDPRTKPAPVYLALCRVAVTTGARLDELVALDWNDLDLSVPSLKIHRQRVC